MKKRKPQPSPVGVVFRGNHEGRAGAVADAMRATERDAEAEKAGPENEAPFTKNPTSYFFERSEQTNLEA
jgi:hypothetical protein